MFIIPSVNIIINLKIKKQMENLRKKLEDCTKMNLGTYSLQQLISDVILPKIAGRPDSRNSVNSNFMKLMTDYGLTIYKEDKENAVWLYRTAFARLANGALPKQNGRTLLEDMPTDIPEIYKPYFAPNIPQEIMGNFEVEFLLKTYDECDEIPEIHPYLMKISFALLEILDSDGKTDSPYYFGVCVNCQTLYKKADTFINSYASENEKIQHWQKPDQWKKHFEYFSRLYNSNFLEKEKFFDAILAADRAPKPLWKRFIELFYYENPYTRKHRILENALKTGYRSYLKEL